MLYFLRRCLVVGMDGGIKVIWSEVWVYIIQSHFNKQYTFSKVTL